VTFAVVLVLFE